MQYDFSWTDYDPLNEPSIRCVVEFGSCEVTNIDHTANTADVAWDLPVEIGEHNIAVVVGDYDWWLADWQWVDVTL